MRIDTGMLGWGVFLVLLGGIPLAVSTGALDPGAVSRAWQLWPLIVIGIGLSFVLRRTAIEPVGGLVVAATFGIMLGGAIAGGFRVPFAGGSCGLGSGAGEPFAARDGEFTDRAVVRVELDCGTLAIEAAPGGSWTLSGEADEGRGPDLDSGPNSLRVASADGGGFLGAADAWSLTLPTEPALDLAVEINAGSGRAVLDGARVPVADLSVNAGELVVRLDGATEVGDLRVDVNAGAARVTLPDASLRGSVSANAGSVELCTTGTAALRVTTDESFAAGYDLPGLVDVGDAWESPGYAGAANRIDLDVSANAGSVSLNPEDGCDG